jgi:threonine/homoserine/homoserine lactone efflux protein
MMGFMFVAAFTPGPNNIMLAASGANFGFTRTTPHMIGVTAGFSFLLVLAGFGLDQVFQHVPVAQQVFRLLALGFILWLSWNIATAVSADDDTQVRQPLRFWQAATFQLINPKALVMSVSVISTYIDPAMIFLPQFIVLLLSFAVITHLSVMTWAAFGLLIRRFIQTPKRFRAFNITMAVLLVISILPVVRDIFV